MMSSLTWTPAHEAGLALDFSHRAADVITCCLSGHARSHTTSASLLLRVPKSILWVNHCLLSHWLLSRPNRAALLVLPHAADIIMPLTPMHLLLEGVVELMASTC